VCLATAATGAEKLAIDAVVKYCVNEMHAKDDFPSQNFDAYYNAATGKVQNNVIYVRDEEPLYRFQKCVAMQGIPIDLHHMAFRFLPVMGGRSGKTFS
jgi:hypothetical protein